MCIRDSFKTFGDVDAFPLCVNTKDTAKIVEMVELLAPTFGLSLIHISEPTRQAEISYAVFCLKKFFFNDTATTEIYTLSVVGSVRCV